MSADDEQARRIISGMMGSNGIPLAPRAVAPEGRYVVDGQLVYMGAVQVMAALLNAKPDMDTLNLMYCVEVAAELYAATITRMHPSAMASRIERHMAQILAADARRDGANPSDSQ